jgi:hypothetical protein
MGVEDKKREERWKRRGFDYDPLKTISVSLSCNFNWSSMSIEYILSNRCIVNVLLKIIKKYMYIFTVCLLLVVKE